MCTLLSRSRCGVPAARWEGSWCLPPAAPAAGAPPRRRAPPRYPATPPPAQRAGCPGRPGPTGHHSAARRDSREPSGGQHQRCISPAADCPYVRWQHMCTGERRRSMRDDRCGSREVSRRRSTDLVQLCRRLGRHTVGFLCGALCDHQRRFVGQGPPRTLGLPPRSRRAGPSADCIPLYPRSVSPSFGSGSSSGFSSVSVSGTGSVSVSGSGSGIGLLLTSSGSIGLSRRDRGGLRGWSCGGERRLTGRCRQRP
jgi:hypothetical protein